jgi:hypothetical protein
VTSERPVQFALAAVIARLAGQPGFDAWSLLGGLLLGIPVAMPPVEDGERLAAPAYP